MTHLTIRKPLSFCVHIVAEVLTTVVTPMDPTTSAPLNHYRQDQTNELLGSYV